MEKTYSQKIARVFEIICYVLLAPTLLILIYPVFFVIGGAIGGSGAMVLIGLIPFLIVAPGIALHIGYFRHSRGRMDETNVPALWLGTAIYNFLLLITPLFAVSKGFHERSFDGTGTDSIITFGVFLTIVFGYLAAIVFSLKAYSFEKRKKIF